MKIDIALGYKKNAKNWKNEIWSWDKIKKRLSSPETVAYTLGEIKRLSKARQSELKDRGGYVGGFLQGGKRSPSTVLHRQILSLDIDEGHVNLWDDFTCLFACEALMHGSFSHTSEKPKYRLVIPLASSVTADQYQAVTRYVARCIGLEMFDPTTFQPERLMFWPVTAKNAAFYLKHQTGDFLDADDILDNCYTDWRDSSSWPGMEKDLIKNAALKQENPEEKKGLIGVFCRTFDIHAAIEEFLSDKYTPDSPDRYTYSKGSTSSGLIVYNDIFAYSHHGTDPICGKLCNAFDLVRIHLFGTFDTGNERGEEKRPSYIKMLEMCAADKKIKKALATEKISSAFSDFESPLERKTEKGAETEVEWGQELEVDKSGKYLSSAHNIKTIFQNDPNLKGCFGYNSFANLPYVLQSLPWRGGISINTGEPIKNVDFSGLRSYFDQVYGISASQKIDDGLLLAMEKNAFDPVKQYLESLYWDGTNRIDRLLIDYFGAEDSNYVRMATRKSLVGAVSRVFVPGIKFDTVLVLVGPEQGTGKSTFFSRLGGPWFSDSFHTVKDRVAFEQLQGAWIIEIAELSGLRKQETEAIKHFITKRTDRFRPAYGRVVEEFQRRCVFFATTNKMQFLVDPTGNRRFWPVEVREAERKKNPLAGNSLQKNEVDQIWAEALTMFREGEKIYFEKSTEKQAENVRGQFEAHDERKGLIENFLDMRLPPAWENMSLMERLAFLGDPLSPNGVHFRQRVCIAEIWCECMLKPKKDITRYATKELNEIMRNVVGWEEAKKSQYFPLYGKQRYYERKFT